MANMSLDELNKLYRESQGLDGPKDSDFVASNGVRIPRPPVRNSAKAMNADDFLQDSADIPHQPRSERMSAQDFLDGKYDSNSAAHHVAPHDLAVPTPSFGQVAGGIAGNAFLPGRGALTRAAALVGDPYTRQVFSEAISVLGATPLGRVARIARPIATGIGAYLGSKLLDD